MQAVRSRGMDIGEFLAWERAQDEKHELIDGVPVARKLRMLAGGTRRHARIAGNIVRHLGNRLAKGPCAPYGSDLAVESPTGAVRYPDITIDCGQGDDRAVLAEEPRVIIEVLSPSNETFQQTRLLNDYQAIESVAHIVYASQDARFAQVWTRTYGGWRLDEVEGLQADIALPAISVVLPMAEAYEGVTFESLAP